MGVSNTSQKLQMLLTFLKMRISNIKRDVIKFPSQNFP